MSSSYQDGLRKCVHLKFLFKTHLELRALLFRKNLSMQEVFEEFAQRIVANDPICDEIFDAIIARKREKTIKSIVGTDADTIFDEISNASPIR